MPQDSSSSKTSSAKPVRSDAEIVALAIVLLPVLLIVGIVTGRTNAELLEMFRKWRAVHELKGRT